MAAIFADDIFKRIFLDKNVIISIQYSLKFVPKGPIDNKSALVLGNGLRLFGAKPLPEPVLTQFIKCMNSNSTYRGVGIGRAIR